MRLVDEERTVSVCGKKFAQWLSTGNNCSGDEATLHETSAILALGNKVEGIFLHQLR